MNSISDVMSIQTTAHIHMTVYAILISVIFHRRVVRIVIATTVKLSVAGSMITTAKDVSTPPVVFGALKMVRPSSITFVLFFLTFN